MSKSEMIPTLHLGKWVQFRIVVDGETEMYNVSISALMREDMGHIKVHDWTQKWVVFSADNLQMTMQQRMNMPSLTGMGFFWCSMDRFLSMWLPKSTEQKIIDDLEVQFIDDLENEKIAAERAEQENNRSLNIAEDTGANM